MSILALFPSFIWSFLSVFVPFLFVLTIVVFIHEMGHFLVARWCGVKVEAFSIGFGKEIFHFHDRHGTRWRLAWIPLGGYVKFMDDQNGASVPSRQAIDAMTPEQRAGAFHAKPLWQRAAVVAAGPIANFILAVLIFAGMFSIVGQMSRVARVDLVVPNSPAARAGFRAGDVIREVDGSPVAGISDVRRIEYFSGGMPVQFVVERGGVRVDLTATPEKKQVDVPFGGKMNAGILGIETIVQARAGAVSPGSAADKAGMRAGDLVRRIDNKDIVRFSDLQKIVEASPGKALAVDVERDGRMIALSVVPDRVEKKDKSGKQRAIGRFGITAWQNPADWSYTRHNPLKAVALGVKETHFIITRTLGYIYDVIVGRESADQLGGPIRIAEVSGQAASLGFVQLLNLAAVLSVSVGLINLFPIPLLDGGHLLFYAIEGLRRRPLSERAQEFGFKIGLALVLALMLFSTFNDLPILRQWFSWAG